MHCKFTESLKRLFRQLNTFAFYLLKVAQILFWNLFHISTKPRGTYFLKEYSNSIYNCKNQKIHDHLQVSARINLRPTNTLKGRKMYLRFCFVIVSIITCLTLQWFRKQICDDKNQLDIILTMSHNHMIVSSQNTMYAKTRILFCLLNLSYFIQKMNA